MKVLRILFQFLIISSCQQGEKLIDENQSREPASQSRQYISDDIPKESVSCPPSSSSPLSLSETCYFDLTEDDKKYLNFSSYQVQYPLWTDGAQKERWIYLPPGQKINNETIDEWRFPVGSTLWKTFVIDGVKIETRMLQKIDYGTGRSSWSVLVFEWNEEQSDATVIHSGKTLPSGYKIPSTSECIRCHVGRSDMVIGFEGIQIDQQSEDLNMNKLGAFGLITHKHDHYYQIHGKTIDKQALGYLHANCSHCHNPDGYDDGNILGGPQFLNLRHASNASSFYNENAFVYLRAFGKISPGDAAGSQLIYRMGATPPYQMPAIGVTIKDDEGIALLSDWINQL